ncbi:MAG: AraC family transcriptional regulator [Acetatifactor sp.]|nr:AraC family transcriptional regulator [Acetatifactor sp.]
MDRPSRSLLSLPLSNFTDILTQIRLDEAKRLLTERDTSVSEAAKSGFRDSVYFSTVFRKHEGISPAGYKKKMK